MFGLNDDQSLRLVYLTILLVALVGSIGFGRNRTGTRFRHLGVWVLVIVGLVAAYAYRGPVAELAQPVLDELTPSRVVEATDESGEQQLVVRRADDGHFHIDAEANGVSVRFLVDTGASTTVLTSADARRAGIDMSTLSFNRPVQTANGTALYASARLDTLTIGPFRMTAVPIGVMPDGATDTSLLGMSTIDRFPRWSVDGDKMVLVPRSAS